MSFIRPELRLAFARWSEVIAGLAVAALGALTASQGGYFWIAIGGLIAIFGAVIAYAAWRRMGLATDKIGPGVVEVDERQISYFGAYDGGTVAVDSLARVTAMTNSQGPWAEDLFWVLEEDGGNTISIPNSAAGADNLFDAFSALPGVDFAAATRALGSTQNDSYVIWSKDPARLH
jgi:hypothetical protein